MHDFSKLYDESYFANRQFNDQLRLKSFEQEKYFLQRHISLSGRVCDVGCATGEFLSYIGWDGERYGMEISEEAIKQATRVGISFEKNIHTENDFFDTVVFRGTIQHLPDPFLYINKAYSSLKKGGTVVFLATPNVNSITYKLFNTLPMLDDKCNFYLPSDVTLTNILTNYKFQVLEVEKPYLNSPYSKILRDHFRFLQCLALSKKPNFAFWGSMMNLIARKI